MPINQWQGFQKVARFRRNDKLNIMMNENIVKFLDARFTNGDYADLIGSFFVETRKKSASTSIEIWSDYVDGNFELWSASLFRSNVYDTSGRYVFHDIHFDFSITRMDFQHVQGFSPLGSLHVYSEMPAFAVVCHTLRLCAMFFVKLYSSMCSMLLSSECHTYGHTPHEKEAAREWEESKSPCN